MHRSMTVIIVTALTVGSVSTSVWAGEMAPDTEALYTKAKKALDDRRFDDAMAFFRSALGRAPAGPVRWRMLLGIALTYELMRQRVEAIEFYERFLWASTGHAAAKEPKWATRRQQALTQAQGIRRALAETRGTVVLVSRPERARVYLNGKPAGADGDMKTPARLYLPPGVHEIALRLPGFEKLSRQVRAFAGERIKLDVALTKVAIVKPPPPKPVERSSPVAAYASLGAGAGLLVIGGLLHGLAWVDVPEINAIHERDNIVELPKYKRLTEQSRALSTSAFVMYGLGGATAAVGLILLILHHEDPDPKSGSVSVSVSRDGAAALFGGRF